MSLKCRIILTTIIFIFVFPQEVRAKEGNFIYYIALDENDEEYWKRDEVVLASGCDMMEQVSAIFNELFSEEIIYQIPKAAILLDVEIREGHLFLNLSKEIKEYGGTFLEMRIKAQIVKTALDIDGIDKVTLLIEGKAETLPEGSSIDEEAEETACQGLMEEWNHS